MPMRIFASLTPASTTELLLCRSRGGGGSGDDEVLDRFPAIVRLFPVNRHIGAAARRRLLGRRIGHLQRVMAATIGQLARSRDLDAVGGEGEFHVRIAGQGLDLLAPAGGVGRERSTGRAERCVSCILAGERVDVPGSIVLFPLRFLRLDVRSDLGSVGVVVAPASVMAAGKRECGRCYQRERRGFAHEMSPPWRPNIRCAYGTTRAAESCKPALFGKLRPERGSTGGAWCLA